MEMLAASKMNLRSVFAAGWQEGDAGGRQSQDRGCAKERDRARERFG